MRLVWRWFAKLLVRAVLGALFDVRIDSDMPRRGPLIVVANHQGWADGFLIAAAFPLAAPVRFLGDRDGTMGSWWHRAVLQSLDLVIPIDRSRQRADRGAIASTLAALERGEIVVVFAEGRVSHTEAALGDFARGVGYLALRAGAAVLPVWLGGTAELYLRRQLRVSIGEPRVTLRGTPSKEATIALSRTLRQDLADLSRPWREPARQTKRWRWLTDVF
jgi:1-acyl-sn-glycerol-3-phosphate acyltransferase